MAELKPVENKNANKFRGVGADGLPRLPPIVTPEKNKEDKFANSKLMNFRMATHKQGLLKKIM
jgi:hypothetical protein